MRTLMGGVMLVLVGTGSVAQEESCVSALDSRIRATEAVVAAMPRLHSRCNDLKVQLEAFVAAESALRKSHKSVRRACPAGEFVRADSDGSVRAQFVVEAVKSRLATCTER